jgi:hypothetical protein
MTSVENKMNNEINAPASADEVKVIKTKKVRKPKEEAVVEPVKEVSAKQEEELQIENFDDELAEQEKIIKEAQAKTAELRLKKQLTEKAPEFLEKIIQRKKRSLKGAEERMKEAVEAWEKEIAEIEGDLETLEAIDLDEDDVMGFLADNYAEEVNVFLAVIYPETKTKTKTETKKATKKDDDDDETDKSKAIKERKDQWSNIPEGTKMEMMYNKSGRIYTKTGNGLVDADGNEYKSMNDAIRKYNQERGVLKSFGSAWNLFKVYDA